MEEFAGIGSRDKLSAEIHHSCTHEEKQYLIAGAVSTLQRPIVKPFQRHEDATGRVSKETGSQMEKEGGGTGSRTNEPARPVQAHTYLPRSYGLRVLRVDGGYHGVMPS